MCDDQNVSRAPQGTLGRVVELLLQLERAHSQKMADTALQDTALAPSPNAGAERSADAEEEDDYSIRDNRNSFADLTGY